MEGSYLQALIFPKEKYSKRDVNNFLKRHSFVKIKPIHTTKHFHRVRLVTPDYNNYYYKMGKLGNTDIKAVFGFKK